MRVQTDVIVAGGGMAGLVAAVRALEHDADVVLVEKSHRLGGTLPVTGGTIAIEPDADPAIDTFEPIEEGVSWLEENGVTIRDPDEQWLTEDAERFCRIEPERFIDRMADLITEWGGDIRTETAFKRLTTTDGDEICGAVVHDEDHGAYEIDAESVILATGGFSGNVDLLEQYLPNADLWNGRHPWCTGEGFIAAREAGAKTTRALSAALGGVRPAPPAQMTEENRRSASTVYRNKAIMLNGRGERFTDESKHVSGSTDLVAEFLNNVEENGYIVLDQQLYEDHTGQMAMSPQIGELVEGARDIGAPVVEADSLPEFADALSAEGVDGEQAVRTIERFNEAMSGNGTKRLRIPRETNRRTIDDPPFYAVAVQPSIVYIRGGLDIDHNARVISQPRSTTGLKYTPTSMKEVALEPIPGLYAAGIEAGRSQESGYYHLGLSLGLSTGRVAGKHAAERALEKAN